MVVGTILDMAPGVINSKVRRADETMKCWVLYRERGASKCRIFRWQGKEARDKKRKSTLKGSMQ